MQEEKRNIEMFLADIEKVLPPIVFRNWPKWRDVLPIAPRTVANEDCLGTGPKEKVMVGRVCGYPRAALIAWLRERSRVILKGGGYGKS
jgi:hypothetical protein